jgi:hypothetical protein
MRLLFQILFIGFSVTLSGQTAGPDQFMCYGGSVQIGQGTLCEGCCARWIAFGALQGAIANPNSLITTVNAPGEYFLVITNSSGDFVAGTGTWQQGAINTPIYTPVDKVVVALATMEIQIFDPKFMSGTAGVYNLVPSADKLSIGAQTFVNYDSDDNDSNFDLTDTEISGGDDEFIKIIITYKVPNTSGVPIIPPVPKIVLREIVNEAGSVRYWLSEDKTKGEYFIGGEVPGLKLLTDGYTVELWVEGTKGHTKQKATQVYAEVEGTLCKSDPVSITVLDVLEMKWEGIGNGYTADGKCNSNVLDVTNFHKTGTVLNYRAFVDAPLPVQFSGSIFQPSGRLRVFFTLKYTTSPVKKFSQFFKIFDIDDPDPLLVAQVSDIINQGLDPNDGTSPIGLYDGVSANIAYTKDGDNRGTNTKAGTFDLTSTLSMVTPFLYKDDHFLQSYQYTFNLNDRPGDNFRLALFPDSDFTKELRNQDQFDQLKITHQIIPCVNSSCAEISPNICSPIITSWRTLHVEFDRMDKGTWDDNLQIKGSIINFTPKSGSNSILSTTNVKLDKILNSNDLSPLSPQPGGDFTYGRFQNGKIFFGNPIVQSTSMVPKGNGADILYFNSAGVDLTNGGKLTATFAKGTSEVTFNVTDIQYDPASHHLIVFLHNPTGAILSNLSGFDFQLLNGKKFPGGVLDANSVSVKIARSSFSLPITLRDDDDDPEIVLPMPLPVGIKNIYNQAFINIDFLSGASDLLSFRPNMLETPGASLGTSFSNLATDKLKNCLSCSLESMNYWSAFIADEWQYVKVHDWDSFAESDDLVKSGVPCPLGRSVGSAHNYLVVDGGQISILFNQTHFDGYKNSLDPYITIAHEIGHQFGLENHNSLKKYPNSGIMSAAIDITTLPSDLYFVPWHLNLIRLRISSPGKKI